MTTTKFIKVTEVYSDGTHIPLLLNVDCISSIKKAQKGKDTFVNMSGEKHYFFVKESLNELEQMIGIGK